MSLVVQISDTHFGTERPEVVRALHDAIGQLAPDLVVLSGDVTQRARRTQFDAARRFIDSYARPTLVVPGNHDVPLFNLAARLFDPFGGYRRVFGRTLEPVVDTDDLLVIGVNTVRAARHKNGEVSRKQIAHIAERLRHARDTQLRIVVTHQPVHVIREKDIDNLLIGHEGAIDAWSDTGADLVLGGHIHLPYVRPLKNGLWSVQAGTALSTRIREGISNSFHAIRHEGMLARVDQWNFDEGSQVFRAGTATDIPLRRR
ncbi:MAG: 3',5'-cyclic adenosine monophosphate phosphodiesterase CpdA [Luteibacter sp.]|uniref:metallophosphoesterase family protein n=1 Tax=Luteibacter sp. TaxID=1886636 RepID=UPI001385DA1B|nr:metallophosphoesterase [Luteibacter sp.]KAF1005353.1 MAG: 3',5'-cyclic adenosine monophosphate phosphodiesterase CpdA [Luteibacter sp.]